MSKQHSKIRVTISYGYDIHSLELLASDFERIKKGESLAIIGQGFSIEGEMTQDTWLFKNKTIRIILKVYELKFVTWIRFAHHVY